MSYYTTVKIVMRKDDYDYMVNCPPEYMKTDYPDDLAYTKRIPVTYGSKSIWTNIDESEYKHLPVMEQIDYIKEHQYKEVVNFVIIDVGETNHFPSRIEYLWNTVESVPTEYILIDEDYNYTHVDKLGTELLYMDTNIGVFDNYSKVEIDNEKVPDGVAKPLVDKAHALLKKKEGLESMSKEDLRIVFDYVEQLIEERDRLRKAVISMQSAAEELVKIEL